MHFFFLLCDLLLLTALPGSYQQHRQKQASLGAALWEHEGRETSTLFTIHLRLMCAAGGPPPAPTCLKRSPAVQLPLACRSDNTQARALVHDRFPKAKLLAWSWKSFARSSGRTDTDGGVTTWS